MAHVAIDGDLNGVESFLESTCEFAFDGWASEEIGVRDGSF